MRLTLPYLNLTSRLSSATQDLHFRLQDISSDVTSGRRSNQVEFLKGDIGQAMLAHRATETIAGERELVTLKTSRLALTQRNLDAVHASAEGIALNIADFVGVDDRASLGRTSSAAKVALESIFSSLNTRHGDRHLFSGDATDRPALVSVGAMMTDLEALKAASVSSQDFDSRIDDYFNSPSGGWLVNIYQGTTGASEPDQVVASDPEFTRLVSGLAVAALVDERGWDPASVVSKDSLISASSRISSGRDGVSDVRARLGLVEAQLSDRGAALDQEETIATQALGDLTTRDPYEAALELQQLEINLETAYALTARLSELSLLNFLR